MRRRLLDYRSRTEDTRGNLVLITVYVVVVWLFVDIVRVSFSAPAQATLRLGNCLLA